MAANNIEANGAKAISQSLRVNASLLTLDLSSNPLGPLGRRLFSAFSFMLLLNSSPFVYSYHFYFLYVYSADFLLYGK